jgi:hypothetical protein
MPRRDLPNQWTYIQFLSVIMVFLSSLLVAFTNFANTEQTTSLKWHIRSAPQVDLGYAIYAGTYNASSELDVFKGYVVEQLISNPNLRCYYVEYDLQLRLQVRSDGKRLNPPYPIVGV